MDQITYKPIDKSTSIRVLLGGKAIGVIRPLHPGFAYYPRSSKTSGDVFQTLDECKHSLESDDAEQNAAAAAPGLVDALKSVIAAHCPNGKLFCGSCSPAREVLALAEAE